jgi:hypothetical protein
MACESQDTGLIGGVEKREINIVDYDHERRENGVRPAILQCLN